MIKNEKPFFLSPKTENQISAKKGKHMQQKTKRNFFTAKTKKQTMIYKAAKNKS